MKREMNRKRVCPEVHEGKYFDFASRGLEAACDDSESLKFLCSTRLTVWVFFFSFVTLILSFPLLILISPFLKHLGTPEEHLVAIALKVTKNSNLSQHHYSQLWV